MEKYFQNLTFDLCLLFLFRERGVKMIPRPEYLEELKKWKDKDLIKVVTGIRRCGKTTLIELFIDYLKENNIKDS